MKVITTAMLLGVLLFGNADAERTVKGKITDRNGNPVSDFRVKAYDYDTLSPDELMGEAMTGQNGRYSITYEGGHWDKAPDWTTKWRPDIYIKISMRVNGYCSGGEWDPTKNWIHMGDSSVTSNHPHREDLTKNVQLQNHPIEMRVEDFELKKNMYCEVDLPGRHSCFACSASGQKVEWTKWGITSVPMKRTHCWFNFDPPQSCSDSDWQRIREGPSRTEPQRGGGELQPPRTDERSGNP